MQQRQFILIALFITFSMTTWAQSQGVGIRAGDPLGITYKRYLPHNNAVEFIFGTAPRRWHQNYYENAFYEYDKYDGYRYQSHFVESTIYLSGRYLLHYDLMVDGMEGKWQWYWGVGALLKFAKVEYRYRDDLPPNNWMNDIRTDIDLGPEGIFGTEYSFDDLPLTFFGEVSLMLELADRPATLRGFGALGVRLNL